MIQLKSYACGSWVQGTDSPRSLHNPATEEVLGECGSGGIEYAEALDYARRVGGPALRAVGFAERAAWLKAISAALHEHREEFIELSVSNGGNTRGDAKFDIDGMTGTLAAYASFGKRLGDGNHLPDGDGVQLGRTARFWGQHVRVPRLGVAVHINAFNFPGWGMGEKLATSVLAGVPAIEKPGTPSAILAFRIAERLVEADILPAGAFQFIAGSTGDLLDHLGPQDALAFTGSAWTGAKLKANPSFVERNARVNIEADSLNVAIMDPSLDGASETFDQFIRNVFVDMTQKAGQKCTAVRRILVPTDRLDEVVERLKGDLEGVRFGNPADDDVRMGPVASESALRDVLAGTQKLAAACEVLCGSTERAASPGYFVAPTLLLAKDADADVLHADEVFGPVATLIPYDGSVDEAARLANRGGGGLVASAYSNDADWTEGLIHGIGPWHGRVWVGSDKVAGQATAPGLVLPATIHGGPGRAGGGEELGGLRGLEFYMQRVALQGFQGVIGKRFGPAADAD